MRLILQIGRPDSKKDRTGLSRNSVSFLIDRKSYTEPLSGIALKRYFMQEGKEAKLILIYPSSIVFSDALEPPKDLEEYYKSPKTYLQKVISCNDVDDFFVIHSLGTYKYREQNVEFEAHYNDIVLQIFFELVDRYLKYLEEKKQPEEFYFDISTGHNVYVVALVEAVNQFLNFLTFFCMEQEKVPTVYQVFSDPVIGNTTRGYKIYFECAKYDLHFESPMLSYLEKQDVAPAERLNFLSKKLKEPAFAKEDEDSKETRTMKRKLKGALLSSLLVFLAFFRSIPLPLYYLHRSNSLDESIESTYHTPDQVIGILCRFVNYTLGRLNQSFRSSPDLKKDFLIAIVNELAFYVGLVRTLEKCKIKPFDEEKGLELESLKNQFEGMLEKMKMKSIFFENEIDRLGSDLKDFRKSNDESDQWISLSCVYDSNVKHSTGPHQRNFYAHAGLERNITELRFEGDKIYLRYASNAPFKLIFKYLLEA